AVTAAFARCMPNFPVDPPREAYFDPVAVYHAQPYSNQDPLGQPVRPSIFVDTTPVIERKVAMLACHRSQKEWLDASQGLDSYLNTLRELDAQVGSMSQRFQYAEGWRKHLHLGFGGANDDPLVSVLTEAGVAALA